MHSGLRSLSSGRPRDLLADCCVEEIGTVNGVSQVWGLACGWRVGLSCSWLWAQPCATVSTFNMGSRQGCQQTSFIQRTSAFMDIGTWSQIRWCRLMPKGTTNEVPRAGASLVQTAAVNGADSLGCPHLHSCSENVNGFVWTAHLFSLANGADRSSQGLCKCWKTVFVRMNRRYLGFGLFLWYLLSFYWAPNWSMNLWAKHFGSCRDLSAKSLCDVGLMAVLT